MSGHGYGHFRISNRGDYGLVVIVDGQSGKEYARCWYILGESLKFTKDVDVQEVNIAARDPKPVEYIAGGQPKKTYKLFFDCTDIPSRLQNQQVKKQIDLLMQAASRPVTFFLVGPQGENQTAIVSKYPCFIINFEITPLLLDPLTKDVIRAEVTLGCLGR